MNYDEIVAAAKAYADRNDIEVSTNMDTFLLLCEAKMNRLLKVRQQSTRIYTPAIVDRQFYTLPSDYAGMRDIQKNSGNPTDGDVGYSSCTLEYVTPEKMNDVRNKPFDGTVYYTVNGFELNVYPAGDAGDTFELLYFQKVPALTDGSSDDVDEDTTRNWVSDDNPDLYIAGLVSEIELFAKNYAVGKEWHARMAAAIDEIETASVEETWAGTSLYTRIG